MARTNGVSSLSDIKDRCRIEDETGCWTWAMAAIKPGGCVIPVVHMAPHVLGLGRRPNNMPAARAAWLLSGRDLKPDHVVYRYTCTNKLCVNPAHCRSGTRQKMHADISATGRNRGSAERKIINAINRASMIIQPEVVRKAESLFDQGATIRAVAAEVGIDKRASSRIKRGLHPHSRNPVSAVMGASVFSWRP